MRHNKTMTSPEYLKLRNLNLIVAALIFASIAIIVVSGRNADAWDKYNTCNRSPRSDIRYAIRYAIAKGEGKAPGDTLSDASETFLHDFNANGLPDLMCPGKPGLLN